MSQSNSTRLSGLANGQAGKVLELHCHPAMTRRLSALGMLPGVSVRVLRRALGGDPLMIDVLGHPIALRRADAHQIIIEAEHAPA